MANEDLTACSTSLPAARPRLDEICLIVAAPVPTFRTAPKPIVAVNNIQCPYFSGPSVCRKYGVAMNTSNGFQPYSRTAQVGLASFDSIQVFAFSESFQHSANIDPRLEMWLDRLNNGGINKVGMYSPGPPP